MGAPSSPLIEDGWRERQTVQREDSATTRPTAVLLQGNGSSRLGVTGVEMGGRWDAFAFARRISGIVRFAIETRSQSDPRN